MNGAPSDSANALSEGISTLAECVDASGRQQGEAIIWHFDKTVSKRNTYQDGCLVESRSIGVGGQSVFALGTTSQEGFCNVDNLRQVLSRKTSALSNCYERQQLVNPKLAGAFTMKWKVGIDGRVKDARVTNSTLKNEKVETCAARVFGRMRFPAPDGGICVVEQGFSFSAMPSTAQ